MITLLLIQFHGSAIPGQTFAKMFYLRMRKAFLSYFPPRDSAEELSLLKEEEFKFAYLTTNGMVTKGQVYAIILNISQIVELYGEMNVVLQLEALNSLNIILKSLITHHREFIVDEKSKKGDQMDLNKRVPDLTEILLDDIVALYTQTLEFDRIK
mmetsp:Transcript_31956/g.31349  ORF Transcript_31956/g.31349 Transcript_31956/m.31349 type:complete len:155 (-) Transcript_31956:48-512(-)